MIFPLVKLTFHLYNLFAYKCKISRELMNRVNILILARRTIMSQTLDLTLGLIRTSEVFIKKTNIFVWGPRALTSYGTLCLLTYRCT